MLVFLWVKEAVTARASLLVCIDHVDNANTSGARAAFSLARVCGQARRDGLIAIPAEEGKPIWIASGFAANPVWSPDGNLIVYMGANVGEHSPLIALHPDGIRVRWPNITAKRDGEPFGSCPMERV